MPSESLNKIIINQLQFKLFPIRTFSQLSFGIHNTGYISFKQVTQIESSCYKIAAYSVLSGDKGANKCDECCKHRKTNVINCGGTYKLPFHSSSAWLVWLVWLVRLFTLTVSEQWIACEYSGIFLFRFSPNDPNFLPLL